MEFTVLEHKYEMVDTRSVNLLVMIECERSEKVIREGTEKLFKEETNEEDRKTTWKSMCAAWSKFAGHAVKSPDEFLNNLENIPAFKGSEILQLFFSQLRETLPSKP